MTNYNIKTNQELIQLFKELTESGKNYKLNTSANRIIEVVNGIDIDREAESLFAEFSELYNIHQNIKTFITLFRGYLYNISNKEDLANVIKDDLFYSIFEFVENKKEVTINDICIHLFNISSNKVKQELRSHIARCLTHMDFNSKRTNKGIKWISLKEPTQPTLISKTIAVSTSQVIKEPTLEPTQQGTQHTLPKTYEEEFNTFKELYYKEKDKVKELTNKLADLELQLQEYKSKDRFTTENRFSYNSEPPKEFLNI